MRPASEFERRRLGEIREARTKPTVELAGSGGQSDGFRHGEGEDVCLDSVRRRLDDLDVHGPAI